MDAHDFTPRVNQRAAVARIDDGIGLNPCARTVAGTVPDRGPSNLKSGSPGRGGPRPEGRDNRGRLSDRDKIRLRKFGFRVSHANSSSCSRCRKERADADIWESCDYGQRVRREEKSSRDRIESNGRGYNQRKGLRSQPYRPALSSWTPRKHSSRSATGENACRQQIGPINS